MTFSQLLSNLDCEISGTGLAWSLCRASYHFRKNGLPICVTHSGPAASVFPPRFQRSRASIGRMFNGALLHSTSCKVGHAFNLRNVSA